MGHGYRALPDTPRLLGYFAALNTPRHAYE